jgi:hypothetical protein
MVSEDVAKTVDTVYCRKSEQTEESAMKSLFEELGGTYHQEGDYFLPDLLPPDSISVGIWGQRRKHYLKTQREPVYAALLLGGKLDSHLSEVDAQAEAMLFQLVKQMAKQEGITEQLKADNQMEWVVRMNIVRNRAEEIIYNELIYA